MAASEENLRKAFLKLSGYKEEDIWGINVETLGVVTSNGGKYVVSKDGKSLRTLSGPAFPKSVPAEETAEEVTEEAKE